MPFSDIAEQAASVFREETTPGSGEQHIPQKAEVRELFVNIKNYVDVFTGTSVTPLVVGTGSKTLVTQAEKQWKAGQRLRFASGANIMDGEVTAYSGTSLTINVDYAQGSGSHSAWNIVPGPAKAQGSNVDIVFNDPGRPGAGEEIFRMVAGSTISLPVNLAGSIAKLTSATTATASFVLFKNGVGFAFITFAAGATTATFIANATSFAPGDVLTIVAPNPMDATLAGLHGVILGNR